MQSDGDTTFYTVTMARVYADQGHYAQAARIYRHLLDQTPDREDLKKALDAVTAKLPQTPAHWNDIARWVERWVRMTINDHARRRLQHIRPSRRLVR